MSSGSRIRVSTTMPVRRPRLRRALSDEGHGVEVASDGPSALVAARPSAGLAEVIQVWVVEGAPDPFGDLDEAWKRAFLQALPRP